MTHASPKILDLSYLIEMTGNDDALIRLILTEYLTEMSQYVERMRDPSQEQDQEFLLRAAHTVSGASANVGATRVYETAIRLEAQIKKGQLAGSRSLVMLLAQELHRVKDLVEREGLTQLLQSP